jgi:hypothetical protein
VTTWRSQSTRNCALSTPPGSGLPLGIVVHRPDDGHAALVLTRDEHGSIGAAFVDQMLLGEEVAGANEAWITAAMLSSGVVAGMVSTFVMRWGVVGIAVTCGMYLMADTGAASLGGGCGRPRRPDHLTSPRQTASPSLTPSARGLGRLPTGWKARDDELIGVDGPECVMYAHVDVASAKAARATRMVSSGTAGIPLGCSDMGFLFRTSQRKMFGHQDAPS